MENLYKKCLFARDPRGVCRNVGKHGVLTRSGPFEKLIGRGSTRARPLYQERRIRNGITGKKNAIFKSSESKPKVRAQILHKRLIAVNGVQIFCNSHKYLAGRPFGVRGQAVDPDRTLCPRKFRGLPAEKLRFSIIRKTFFVVSCELCLPTRYLGNQSVLNVTK